jgi:hypothetical protein
MTTETQAANGVLAVIPVTGEVVAQTATTTELVAALELIDSYVDDLRDVRQTLVDEAARRLDANGVRSAEVGDLKLATNPPAEDRYDVRRLRENLEPLIEAGKLDAALLDALIVTPDPKPVEPRVDRRRLNVLLKSDDRELLAALAGARDRVTTRRTLKIERP